MKQLISDKPMVLSVGAFTIHISYFAADERIYYLPDSAELYFDLNNTIFFKGSFTYRIELQDLYAEPGDVPIAGFVDGPFPYQIYRLDQGDYLWIRKNKDGASKLVYQISKDWSLWRLKVDNSGTYGLDSFSELAYLFAYSILNKGGIQYHGVVMEWQGKGILICAHSGVGKTTHSRMWRDNENAHILNGDRAYCYKYEKLWYSCGAPWCGSSGEYKNSNIIINAIVILEQAAINEVMHLIPLQGALELIKLAYVPSWDNRLVNCALDSIDDMVRSIPVLKLRCRQDLEAVTVLKEELQKL